MKILQAAYLVCRIKHTTDHFRTQGHIENSMAQVYGLKSRPTRIILLGNLKWWPVYHDHTILQYFRFQKNYKFKM